MTQTWTLLSTEGRWEYWLHEWEHGREVYRRRVGNGYMFEGEPVGCRWESSWEHYLRFHTPGACFAVG